MANASPRFTYHPPQGSAPAVRFDNETGEAWVLVSDPNARTPAYNWTKVEDPKPPTPSNP